jgi:hypothetical protein
MATTVTKTTFTSKIVESITINSQKREVYTSLSIPEVTDYSHRIMSVATGTSSIMTLGASDAAGRIDKNRFKYLRVTNLDDSNNVRLTIQLTTAADTYEVVLSPKTSHILTSKSGDITTGGAAVSLEDITEIKGTATSSACDVEVFTVST